MGSSEDSHLFNPDKLIDTSALYSELLPDTQSEKAKIKQSARSACGGVIPDKLARSIFLTIADKFCA